MARPVSEGRATSRSFLIEITYLTFVCLPYTVDPRGAKGKNCRPASGGVHRDVGGQ